MKCHSVYFSGHAVRRMFERSLSRSAVVQAIDTGEPIARYADDQPYPSELLLGFVDGKPIHVVVARNAEDGHCIVITAYVPDARLWNKRFTKRRE